MLQHSEDDSPLVFSVVGKLQFLPKSNMDYHIMLDYRYECLAFVFHA